MLKKGISPLIATVLLIGFTIALIALVMIWGRNFIQERAEKEGLLSEKKLSCTNNVDFTVDKACENNAGISLRIKNLRETPLDNFIFRVKGDQDVETIISYQKVESLAVKDIPITGQSIAGVCINSGCEKTIDIIPQLRVAAGVYVPCSAKHLEVRVKSC